MDLTAIGSWAGDKGPYVAIIIFLCRIIQVLLTRLLAQQDLVLKAMQVTEKTAQVASTAQEIAKVATEK